MTNEMDTTKLKDEDILKNYKEQITVEARFRWLKDPTVVDGIYLKNTQPGDGSGVCISHRSAYLLSAGKEGSPESSA